MSTAATASAARDFRAFVQAALAVMPLREARDDRREIAPVAEMPRAEDAAELLDASVAALLELPESAMADLCPDHLLPKVSLWSWRANWNDVRHAGVTT